MASLRNPIKIAGYEKAWAALLTGSAVAAVQVLLKWPIAHWTGAFPVPTPEAIESALDGFVVALSAAAGAYLTANTGTFTQRSLEDAARALNHVEPVPAPQAAQEPRPMPRPTGGAS